jgi:hypothetical protein
MMSTYNEYMAEKIGRNYRHTPRKLKDGVPRILWILGRLQKFGCVNGKALRRAYGMSLRTYHRDIARLRAAGFILIGSREGIRFGGFDETYPEAVRSGPYNDELTEVA